MSALVLDVDEPCNPVGQSRIAQLGSGRQPPLLRTGLCASYIAVSAAMWGRRTMDSSQRLVMTGQATSATVRSSPRRHKNSPSSVVTETPENCSEPWPRARAPAQSEGPRPCSSSRCVVRG